MLQTYLYMEALRCARARDMSDFALSALGRLTVGIKYSATSAAALVYPEYGQWRGHMCPKQKVTADLCQYLFPGIHAESLPRAGTQGGRLYVNRAHMMYQLVHVFKHK